MPTPSAAFPPPRPAKSDPVAQRAEFFAALALDELVKTVTPAAPAAAAH